MNNYEGSYPLRIDLAYARDDNVLFGESIYCKGAKFWLHKSLADIVLLASKICFESSGLVFVLHDGLRTVEAQAAMMKTQRVKDNPHWLEEPRLLSPPGAGGHPRAMAVDIGLQNGAGQEMDMGTVFDFLAENPHADFNPAHRDYKGHSGEVMNNRKILDRSILQAAQKLNMPIFPLPQEWWDFRLPSEIYNLYAPISENDLPPEMRLLA